jgi:hypothetical protein
LMPDGMRLFTISMFLCVYWSPKPKKLKVGDYCTGALGSPGFGGGGIGWQSSSLPCNCFG